MRPRTLVFIGVLAIVLVGGIALGLGSLSDALANRSNGPSQRVSANGWVAYVVALTDWNTPGGPEFETPGSPTRIALVRDGSPSPRYVGGATPPMPGEPLDDWLSVRQQCPSFSPDGTRLAFLERKPDQGPSGSGVNAGTIVIVELDDHGLSTGEELRVAGGCPTWSPDGQHVAFVDAALGSKITILNLDGSQEAAPAPAREAAIVSFAWSPDGRTIAVIDRSFPNGWSAEGNLWLISLDGRAPSLLYDGHTPMQGKPAWSPDGAHIAVSAALAPEPTPNANGTTPSVDQDWAVLVVPVREAGQLREVGRGIGPVWSPTGDRLAYLANPVGGPGPSTIGDIVVVDPSGRAAHAIPDAAIAPGTALSDYNWEGGSGIWRAHPPVWSPDGTKLLFIGSDGGWGTSILLSASPTGDDVPTPMSETWVAEWYGEDAISWQSRIPPE